MSIKLMEDAAVGEDSPPETIVAWVLQRFAGRDLAITTAFGMEGCALIDMVAAHGAPVRVIYLDTMFHFAETYALRDRMAARYPRLTRSQSAERSAIRVVEWDWKYDLLKVTPLATWDRARVWDYVRSHDVPYNELHERGYPTVGCTHCTRPVPGAGPGEYSRTGRWVGTDKTECGLHMDGRRHLARKA